jgi:hypothetical protein
MGITNTGMAEAAGLLGTDTTSGRTAFDYIGVGTGSTTFAATQTDLITPVERIAGTGTRVTTTVTNDTLQLVATHTAGGSETITEAGVFNASSSGVMLSRLVFTGRILDVGETLTVTYKIQVKQGA